MSRHFLIDRPDRQVVLGYDHMLRSFFGQVFDPSKDPGIAIGGWPTSSGLGTRRPVQNYIQADEDQRLLMDWARSFLTEADRQNITVIKHYSDVSATVRHECACGHDFETRPVPACLREPRQ